jgi:Fic family protein
MDWKNHPHQFTGQTKHLDRLSEKKSRLDALRPLPAAAVENIRSGLALEWTFHSNAIEGNTLTLRETRMVVEDGLTIGGKSLREHFEAINHQKAIAFVENLSASARPLSGADILALHALVMQRIAGAGFIPPNALKIEVLLEELIQWANDAHNPPPCIVKAAVFHHRFVWIHPFFDGNGRTARLLSNLLLMKEGFPPAIILKNDRKKYYEALEKANQRNYAKLAFLFMQALERSLDLYLSHLTNSYDDYQPISDIVAEPGFPYGQEYLSLLARQGKIDAFKEGRNWLTSKEAVRRYTKGRDRKRFPTPPYTHS